MSARVALSLFLTVVMVGSVATVGAAPTVESTDARIATNDQFEPNDDFDTAATISEGEYDLRIEGGEDDFFKINLNRSEAIDVAVTNLSSNVDLKLFNGNRDRIAKSTSSFARDEQVIKNPESSGTFYVKVESQGGQTTTNYTLDVDVVTPAENDQFAPNYDFDIAAGIGEGRHEARVWGGEDDYYKLDLNRSEAIDVEVRELSSNVDLKLFDENFDRIAKSTSNFARDEQVIRNPESSGTFYVKVESQNTQTTTNYTLDVDVVTPAENDPYAPNYNFSLAAPISERQGLNGRVTTPRIVGGESDFYALGLVDGDDLTVEVSDLSANVRLDVYDTGLERVGASDANFARNEQVTITANSTGLYYFAVDGKGTQATTDYTLNVDRTRASSSSVALYADGGEFTAGNTVTVDYTLENSGSDASATLALGSLPDGWSVVDQSAADATWDANAETWTWSTLPGGENRTASVTLAVPSDAPDEPRLVPATLSVDGQGTDVRAARVTVGEPSSSPGPSVSLANVGLSPDNVTANTTTDHTLTFDAMDVSDDGNTDTFTVTIPSAAQLESVDGVTITDANSDTVALSGGPDTSGNVLTASVAPDSSADARDLTVEANVTVSAPDVSSTTMADITVAVSDSSNGQDSANVSLTVEPDTPSGPDVPGVSADVSAAVAGDDTSVGRSDILTMVQGYLTGGSVHGVSITRQDVLALVQYYLVG